MLKSAQEALEQDGWSEDIDGMLSDVDEADEYENNMLSHRTGDRGGNRRMKSQKTVSFLGLEDENDFCYDTVKHGDFDSATMFITEEQLHDVAQMGQEEDDPDHHRSGSMVVNDDVEQDSKIHVGTNRTLSQGL